jgi:hypothetical protein
MTQDRYFVLGVALALMGSMVVIITARFKGSVVFEALGFAVVIVGLTAFSLPEPDSGNDTTLALLKGSIYGIEPLLNEIGARRIEANKKRVENWDQTTMISLLDEALEHKPPAVYLPPVGYEGQNSSVYIPIVDRTAVSERDLRNAQPVLLPPDSKQTGVRVFTAGSTVGLLPEIWDDDLSIEETLRRILVQSTKLCSSVKALEVEDSIVLEISDVKEELESNSYRALLGTLPVSIAASIVSAVKGLPFEISSEEIGSRRTVARLAPFKGKRT